VVAVVPLVFCPRTLPQLHPLLSSHSLLSPCPPSLSNKDGKNLSVISLKMESIVEKIINPDPG
jgi:hypothetical protein